MDDKSVVEIVEDRMRRAARGEDIPELRGKPILTYENRGQKMNPQVQQAPPDKPGLQPPTQLAVGTILTIRMLGHSRTNGQDYFAPAIVLDQYDNDQGSIEALVFDSTAGTHYQHSYPIRDLSTRGDGFEREVYELRSNIGEILFSPVEFARLAHLLGNLADRVMRLESIRQAETNAKVSPPIKVHESDKSVR